MWRVLGAVAILLLMLLTGSLQGDSDVAPAHSVLLSETGLYSDIATKTIRSDNLSYSPQYPLWSDGATKQRWVYLPPGQTIDASDPTAWQFPVGTKFWKEFTFGSRVETRKIEKTGADRWTFAAYSWTTDGSDAQLVGQNGLKNCADISQGIRHDIPSVNDCKTCHEGTGREVILGFNALQLSSDRDSLAPHAEVLTEEMITLDDLLARGLLKNVPDGAYAKAPRIDAATPRARASAGYLWANCGGCHNEHDPLSSVGLVFSVSQDSVYMKRLLDWPTVIGHPSDYEIPGLARGESLWIAPGDPGKSTVVYRIASRSPSKQMPPLGTKLIDHEAVELISNWIAEDIKPQETSKK